MAMNLWTGVIQVGHLVSLIIVSLAVAAGNCSGPLTAMCSTLALARLCLLCTFLHSKMRACHASEIALPSDSIQMRLQWI